MFLPFLPEEGMTLTFPPEARITLPFLSRAYLQLCLITVFLPEEPHLESQLEQQRFEAARLRISLGHGRARTW